MNEHKLIEQLNERDRVIESLIDKLQSRDEQIANLTSSLKSVTDMCNEMRDFIRYLEMNECCNCFYDEDCEEDEDCCCGCAGPECPDFYECDCRGECCDCECYECEDDEYDECCLCDECRESLINANGDSNPESEEEATKLAEVEAMIRAETGEDFKHFKRTRTVKEDGSVEYTWLKEVNL